MWASELNISYTTFLHKLNRGLTINEIIEEGKELTNTLSVLYNNSGGEVSAAHLDNGISQQQHMLTLTVPQMADQLNISRATAYALVKDPGFYPAFRIGNRVLISTKALESWVIERTEEEHGKKTV